MAAHAQRARNPMDSVMKRDLRSVVIKRSIILDGHKTSVSLENEFWDGLREIVEAKKTTVSLLVGQIDRERDNCNLSSAIRVYVFNHFRQRDRL
jgi:predicted DNA-binding ribbon-helix-helix protein